MTPKERVTAAMNLQPVDKVPLMCQMSIGHMLLQLDVSPVEFWFDKNVFAESLIKLREIYDFDGILVSLHGHDPDWKENVVKIDKTDEHEIAYLKNGDKIFLPYNDLPRYEFANPPALPDIITFTENDLPQGLNYFPVSQDLPFYIHPEHKFDVINDLVKRAGDTYSIHGEVTSPFDYFLDYIGAQEALMAMIDAPEKCKMILDHFTKFVKQLAAGMCDTGVDAIKISSPYAGAGFISPGDYKEFVMPYESEIIKTIRNKGVHVYIHTCGAIGDRLELMAEAGTSGIECLDPPPMGNVELTDAKERIGGKVFIKGNIDSVNSLLQGSPEEIYNDAKERLRVGSQKGGFILSTACSIAPPVKRENIQILRKVIEEWK